MSVMSLTMKDKQPIAPPAVARSSVVHGTMFSNTVSTATDVPAVNLFRDDFFQSALPPTRDA
jgi:hypothetical protein